MELNHKMTRNRLLKTKVYQDYTFFTNKPSLDNHQKTGQHCRKSLLNLTGAELISARRYMITTSITK